MDLLNSPPTEAKSKHHNLVFSMYLVFSIRLTQRKGHLTQFVLSVRFVLLIRFELLLRFVLLVRFVLYKLNTYMTIAEFFIMRPHGPNC